MQYIPHVAMHYEKRKRKKKKRNQKKRTSKANILLKRACFPRLSLDKYISSLLAIDGLLKKICPGCAS